MPSWRIGGEAGRAGAYDRIGRLVGQVSVKAITLPKGRDTLSSEEVQKVLKSNLVFVVGGVGLGSKAYGPSFGWRCRRVLSCLISFTTAARIKPCSFWVRPICSTLRARSLWGGQQLAQPDKGPHDDDIHLYSAFAVEH